MALSPQPPSLRRPPVSFRSGLPGGGDLATIKEAEPEGVICHHEDFLDLFSEGCFFKAIKTHDLSGDILEHFFGNVFGVAGTDSLGVLCQASPYVIKFLG